MQVRVLRSICAAVTFVALAALSFVSAQTQSTATDRALPAPINLVVSPASVTVEPGATVQFAAVTTGSFPVSLVWTATGGTITAGGRYTAGQTAGDHTVTATVRGGTLSGSAVISIQAVPVFVDIFPGDSIQARINASPTGTAFRLRAGTHTLTAPLTPKDGTSFTGEKGAIVSGARELTGFAKSGNSWVVGGQTQQGASHGSCRSAEFPRCGHPEDVYVDNVMIRHVNALNDLGPGRWYFDYGNDRIHLYDDPTGRRVETTVTPYAFGGTATNVTINGLIIEKFANQAQRGAIAGDSTTHWTVAGNEVRFNHGVGIRIGHSMQVIGNVVHRNGELGIGGVGDNVLVENNEIAYNNVAGFHPDWEAGGTKFVRTNQLVVRNNWVHHNYGPGLWTDIDNRNTLYELNRSEDNERMGIIHEISYSATIRNNTLKRNGFGHSVWLWGAGILVAASPDVEIYGNTLEGNADGIAAVQQRRGSGAFGPYEVWNLWVHDNTIISSTGHTGIVQDVGDRSYFSTRNNRFDRNVYRLGSAAHHFNWLDGNRTDQEWQGYGNDVTGAFEQLQP
jgi:hypothetical protein